MKITIDTSATIAELDAMIRAIRAARPDWVGGVVRSVKSDVEGSMRIASEDRPDVGVSLPGNLDVVSKTENIAITDKLIESQSPDPFKAIREAAAATDTHGSPELDADAAKLTAMGQDAGPTVDQVTGAPPSPSSSAVLFDERGHIVAVDKTGLPWDARIHSETKATLKDGTWRQRRNVSAELVKRVEDQLRAAMAAPPAPAVAAPVTTQAPPPPLPGTPTAPPAPPAPAAPLPGGPSDAFTNLILFITKHKKDGKLNDTQVKLSLEALQMPPSIPLLANRPDLIPALMAKLQTVAGV